MLKLACIVTKLLIPYAFFSAFYGKLSPKMCATLSVSIVIMHLFACNSIPSCACSFICILRQSVTKMCATLSVSIVLKLAFWVTKQLHPPQITIAPKNVLL